VNVDTARRALSAYQNDEDIVDGEDDGGKDSEGMDGHEGRVARRDEGHHLPSK
jgi:hypothetical protein